MRERQSAEAIGREGLPLYLVEHYAHAYLSPLGTRVFDLQFVINAILFGQYRKLMRTVLDFLGEEIHQPALQLTCVYGELSRVLLQRIGGRGLHITDVAPIQLELVRRKNPEESALHLTRMNVERLAYRDDCFQTLIVFFLLHELPPRARSRTLEEIVRVLAPGGRLLVADYAGRPERHPLYRFRPLRSLLQRLEPHLAGFWSEDLDAGMQAAAASHGKTLSRRRQKEMFLDFYRVVEYQVGGAGKAGG